MDLTKELARLAKAKEKIADLNNPSKKKASGPSVKSLLTDLQRAQKAQEKQRAAFIDDVIETKNQVLSEDVEDYDRIVSLLPITQKGIKEAKETFETYREQKAILEAQMYLLEKKMAAAENDIDVLNNAVDNFETFNEAVKAYALRCIEEEEEFTSDEIIFLWDEIVKVEDVMALNRGTTTFSSLDYLLKKVLSNCEGQPDSIMAELEEKVKVLFERYHIS